MLLFGFGEGFAYRLEGMCVDGENRGIAGVNVTVKADGKPELTLKTSTSSSGYFIFDDVPEGKYSVTASCKDYRPITENIDLAKDGLIRFTLEPETVTLKDVEITARKIKGYSDHDELYLSKENREWGLSALDAISSLPFFLTTINGQGISTIAGDKVDIFIDSRRATAEELKSLSGEDIAKVDFYEMRPARFANKADGAMIDIKLRRTSSISYTGRVVATSALNHPDIKANPLFSIMGEHNYGILSLYGGYDYTNRNAMSQTFDYGDRGVNSFTGEKGKSRNAPLKVTTLYQWNKGGHMFLVSPAYNRTYNKSDMTLDILSLSGESRSSGSRHTFDRTKSDAGSLDLYYSYTWPKGQSINVDIVNTYSGSGEFDSLNQYAEESSPYNSFSHSTSIRNNSYSIIGEIQFSSPLWGGDVNVSASYSFKELLQKYSLDSGERVRQNAYRRDQWYTVGYSNHIGQKFHYTVDCALYHTNVSGDTFDSYQQTFVYPTLSLNYSPDRSWNFRMTAHMQSTGFMMGALNNNETWVDTWLVTRSANTNKNWYTYRIMFEPTFTTRDQKFIARASLAYENSPHPFSNQFYRSGDLVVNQMRPSDSPLNTFHGKIALNWRVIRGLQLGLSVRDSYTYFRTPATRISKNHVAFSFSASTSVKEFQFGASVSSPEKRWYGDFRTKSGWGASATVMWRHKSLALWASYKFTEQDNLVIGHIPTFTMTEKSWNSQFRHVPEIGISYTFSGGKQQYNRPQKMINNSDTDTGLNPYQEM